MERKEYWYISLEEVSNGYLLTEDKDFVRSVFTNSPEDKDTILEVIREYLDRK